MNDLIENFFNLPVMVGALPSVLPGFGLTVLVSLLVIVFGLGVGLALALLRSFEKPLLNALITLYVDVFRTLPQLVIIVFLYFGMPYMGLTLSPMTTTVVVLGAVLSAFACEIFVSCMQALPRGQTDAAFALGFGRLRTLFMIILPQAIRMAVPLLTNRAISISKGTAVSLTENLGQAQSYMSIVANPSPLTLAAGFYLLLFIPLVIASRWLEHPSRHGR